MNTDKFCQSCAMPLQDKKTDLRGSTNNGQKSSQYCMYCYQGGKLLEPNLTYDEMLKKGMNGINNNPKMNRLSKWMMRKSYPSLLRQMRRWK